MAPAALRPDSEPIFLAGPTGVGKSALAMHVAAAVGGEIISTDSMQVYRGMDIGTAKPTLEEQRRVRHHLIDVVDPGHPFDAAQWAGLAKNAAETVRRRGGVPIFCGGTGLYFQAILEGLGETPSADAALREALSRRASAELLEDLRRKDPATYAVIDRNNPRRVIRALEVIHLTGRPYSELRSRWCGGGVAAPHFFVIERGRRDLDLRLEARVEAMFAAGLVEETRGLLARGVVPESTAMQAIGYRQVVDYLHGNATLEATIQKVKDRTRQLARRQRTWFRRQTRARWIDLAPQIPAAAAARLVMEAVEREDGRTEK